LVKKEATGGVQTFVSLKYFRGYYFLLLPLAEQRRIVARIEELLPFLEEYDAAE
jgi:type I restriction enzyme S subunit